MRGRALWDGGWGVGYQGVRGRRVKGGVRGLGATRCALIDTRHYVTL